MQINNYRNETQSLNHSEHGRPRQGRTRIFQFAIVAVLASVLTFGCSNVLTDLTHDSGGTEVSLSWTDPTDADFDHLKITWSPEDGESQPKKVSAGTASATLTGLSNCTEYTFTVKAVDDAGNASTGTSDSATPVDPDCGTEKWSFETGDSVSSPAIGSDGTVYFGSSDNNVYASNGGSDGLADTPWPKFGRDNKNTGRVQ